MIVVVVSARAIENSTRDFRGRVVVESPACEAVIEQLPAPVSVITAPLTVQAPLAANETARPELAVADT